MMPRRQRLNSALIPAMVALVVGACAQDTASPAEPAAVPPSLANADLATTLGFRKAVTVAGIRQHQTVFAQISAQGNGGAAVGSQEAEAIAQYVFDRAVAAGYVARIQTYSFEYSGDAGLPELAETSPTPTTFVAGGDFRSMEGSGSGDVTAALYAVDVLTATPGLSTSGCESADFAGFPAGAIALLQRGGCIFRVKALNAANAGAIGVVVAESSDQFPFIPIPGTVGTPQVSIPIVGTSYDAGETLRAGVTNGATGLTVRLKVNYVIETRTGRNVIADSRGGDPAQVIVVGAALAGGAYSPSSNLLSGAATTLEIAKVFTQQGRSTTPKLRFAWFGGNQADRSGATAYLASLSSTDRSRIKAEVNIGAVGSPNYSRFVLDGDNSEFPQPVAADGSDTIERLFTDYFSAAGLTSVPDQFSHAGDHRPFLDGGIPVGGINTGDAGIKTAAEAALFGGTALRLHDGCWLQACDDPDNVSLTALEQMSDAAAHVVLTLSKRNLTKTPL